MNKRNQKQTAKNIANHIKQNRTSDANDVQAFRGFRGEAIGLLFLIVISNHSLGASPRALSASPDGDRREFYRYVG